jgi:hypothetical protein
MGDMTVAYPTTGIAIPQREAPALACTSCGTRAVALDKPFCAHCGSRVSVSVKSGIASIAATRSLQFAALAVLTNILVGGASFGVVYLLSDAARLIVSGLYGLLILGSFTATAVLYLFVL